MDKCTITKELLVSDGWTETANDPTCFAEKKIPNRNPTNNSDDTDIKLILHPLYNSTNFAVVFPDGGMLNFVANSMEELHEFENKITFYESPF